MKVPFVRPMLVLGKPIILLDKPILSEESWVIVMVCYAT